MTAAARVLPLPEFGLGCAPIGDLYGTVDPDVAVATVHAAVSGGATLLDTAPKYGNGLSERRLGLALAALEPGSYRLASKVGWFIDDPQRPPRPAFKADDVYRSIEASMLRLGTDHLDIVHVHDPDDHLEIAADETVPALLRLREQGVIGAIGAGMNDDRRLAELVRRCDFDCVLIAGRYTLLEQPALNGLLPLCEERGVRVIAAGVFNSGLLADPRPGAPYNYQPVPGAVLDRALRIKEVCTAHGVELRTAAMRFPLTHPAVDSILIGAVTPEEILDNLRLAHAPIPDGLWTDLQAGGFLDPRTPHL